MTNDDFILNELEDLRRQVEELITDDKSEASVIDAVLRFPGLVGFWPMSVTNSSGEAVDISGNGLHLTNISNSLFNAANNTVGYVEYDGSADYHSHVDDADFDILGTEAYIANHGLTLGGWFYFDTPGTNSEGLIAKVSTGLSYAYFIQKTVAVTRFGVSGDGTALTLTNMADVAINGWMFLAGKFEPSTKITTYSGSSSSLSITTNTTSIPASIFNSAGEFIIGALTTTPVQPFDGRSSCVFLCSSLVSDTQINDFYELSRPLYGV